MDAIEIEKSKVYNTADIVEYVSGSVAIKAILKKTTGNISIIAFDRGQGQGKRIKIRVEISTGPTFPVKTLYHGKHSRFVGQFA